MYNTCPSQPSAPANEEDFRRSARLWMHDFIFARYFVCPPHQRSSSQSQYIPLNRKCSVSAYSIISVSRTALSDELDVFVSFSRKGYSLFGVDDFVVVVAGGGGGGGGGEGVLIGGGDDDDDDVVVVSRGGIEESCRRLSFLCVVVMRATYSDSCCCCCCCCSCSCCCSCCCCRRDK